MSFLGTKRIAAILAACIVVVILGIAWLYIRDNLRVRHYGESASEAYVVFNRPQPVYYRLNSRGSRRLVSVILKETAAHPLPKMATAVLVDVVFVGADGVPTLSCALPSPKAARSIEDTMNYWEKKIREIETATRVPSEEMSGKLDEKVLYFIRRRSK